MQVINISEIFYSIQGESTYSGLPCIFIRLAGCNLRCNFCDAAYSWDEGNPLSLDSIMKTISQYPSSLVEITGGEPLLQQSCTDLLQQLIDSGKTVLLESNGSIAINDVPEEVIIILDVKCPDSGSKNSFHLHNITQLRGRLQKNPASCELKFVLSSKNDYLWAKQFIAEHKLEAQLPILFSPVHDMVNPEHLADWLMEDGIQARLQLQLHTILWPGISRGV